MTPIAYFITFTCYGTWLHGNKETSVDKFNNIFDTKLLSKNLLRSQYETKKLKNPPYVLTNFRRNIVLEALKQECHFQKWILLAAHVRTNHVHIVIQSPASASVTMNKLKSACSRELNKTEKSSSKIMRWTRHGSTRYLWYNASVEAVIHYVLHEQGVPMAWYVTPASDRSL